MKEGEIPSNIVRFRGPRAPEPVLDRPVQSGEYAKPEGKSPLEDKSQEVVSIRGPHEGSDAPQLVDFSQSISLVNEVRNSVKSLWGSALYFYHQDYRPVEEKGLAFFRVQDLEPLLSVLSTLGSMSILHNEELSAFAQKAAEARKDIMSLHYRLRVPEDTDHTHLPLLMRLKRMSETIAVETHYKMGPDDARLRQRVADSFDLIGEVSDYLRPERSIHVVG